MNIGLSKLDYIFQHKPLLVGGMAMEYYGLRKAGADVDLVIHPDDHAALMKMYPDHIRDLYGDRSAAGRNKMIVSGRSV